MMLLSLLLAAAPPVLLEPDAGNAHRLHPRRVTASSFLSDSLNKHEQNYLPLYIADEDPTTAWVEGVKGRGEGESLEWWGPGLTKAKAYRLFVRNGFQKSARLFRANARPRKVKLEPLVQGEKGPKTTGTPLEVELRDVQGWQEVRLPVPAKVEGVRLKIVTTYPGTKYEDTCLSDVRVYVEGDDPYRQEAEAAAFEQVRAFALERKQAAARKDTGAKVAWPPRYEAEPLLTLNRVLNSQNPVELLARLQEGASYRAALVQARQVAALMQKVDLEGEGMESAEARATWTRVSATARKPQEAEARTALSVMDDEGLSDVAGLLHLDDAGFIIKDDTSRERALATLQSMREREAREREAEERKRESCVPDCEKKNKGDEETDCEQECSEREAMSGTARTESELLEHELQNGEFVQGPMTAPTAFLRGLGEEGGYGSTRLDFRQTLVRYTGKTADVVLVSSNGDVPLRVHVLEWAKSGGPARIASITSFIATSASIRVVRYRPAP